MYFLMYHLFFKCILIMTPGNLTLCFPFLKDSGVNIIKEHFNKVKKILSGSVNHLHSR